MHHFGKFLLIFELGRGRILDPKSGLGKSLLMTNGNLMKVESIAEAPLALKCLFLTFNILLESKMNILLCTDVGAQWLSA